MHETFRDKNSLEDTWPNFLTNVNAIILKIVQEHKIFENHQSIPLVLLLAECKFGKIAESAN
jgi:hypothetical protein